MRISSIMFWLKLLFLFLLAICLCSLILFANVMFDLKLNFDGIYYMDIVPLLFVIWILLSSKGIRRELKKRFISYPDLSKVILIPILVGYLLSFLTYVNVYVFLLSGIEPTVGSGQYNEDLQYFPSSLNFLFLGFFPAVNEEFMFRFFTYSGLFLLLVNFVGTPYNKSFFKSFKDWYIKICEKIYIELFVNNNRFYLAGWLIITSTLFSLMHGPTVTNFHYYFIGGLVDGILFLRYGLLASIISHATFNSISGFNNELVRNIFLYFISK